MSELCSTTKSFQNDITMAGLCEKLYLVTGILPQDMQLILESQDKVRKVVANVPATAETRPLSHFSSLERIVVEDTNSESLARQLANTNDVEEFQLSESDYAKKHNTVLNWKIRNKLGRFNPEHQLKMDTDKKRQQDRLKTLQIGERCSVKSVGQPERRGWLRYVGKIPELDPEDVWCGIEFDEPVGKNNGSCKNRAYFGPVLQNYGGFIKPIYVETGPQFEALSIDLESDDFTDDDEV